MRVSKNWRKRAEIYRIFCEDGDFGEEAAEEAYLYETCGQGDLRRGPFGTPGGKCNGYAVGKHWMDATLRMWCQGIREYTLFPEELYDDGRYPHWWLDSVLPGPVVRRARDSIASRER